MNLTLKKCCLGLSILIATKLAANPINSDMVVVGARTELDIQQIAADITVITAEEIDKSAASTLSEILRGLASIQVADNATNTTISIRGFSAEQAGSNTLILLNGRRLNYSDLAAPQLATIPVNQILRIEILNSSAGVVYGDQAVGGVINIITKQNRQPLTEIMATIGSFENSTFSFLSSVDLAENWNFEFSAKQKNTDNFRKHNQEQLQQQQVALNHHTENYGITFAAENTNQDINTPGALLAEDLLIGRDISRTEFANDFLKFKTRNYRLSSYVNFLEGWLFEIDLQQNQDNNRSLTSFINFQNTSESTTARELFSVTPRFSKKYETDFGLGNVTAGVDYLKSDYSFSLLGRSNQQILASSYIHISHPIAEKLILNGGVRYAEVEDKLTDAFTYSNGVKLTNNASLFNLGLVYRFSQDTRIFASIEQNFRFAKVDEQAYTSPGVIGLNPQLGESIDLGFSTDIRDTQLKLSLYHLSLKDEIVFDASATPPVGAFFQGANVNSDQSTREGARLELSKQLNEQLHLDLNLAWVNARFSAGFNKNQKIPGVSKNISRLNFHYSISQLSNLELEYVYTGERKQDGDNSGFFNSLKSYSLLNLGYLHNFAGKLKNWQLSVRLNNILDKEYISFAQFNGFYPAAGLNGNLNIRYQLD